MVSLHPGHHDPPIPIHYHILWSNDGIARGGVLFSPLAASLTGCPSWRAGPGSPWLHALRGPGAFPLARRARKRSVLFSRLAAGPLRWWDWRWEAPGRSAIRRGAFPFRRTNAWSDVQAIFSAVVTNYGPRRRS